MEVHLVDVEWLKPHEETRRDRVEELRQKIAGNGFVHKPLLVDQVTGTILDGHHRYTAGLALGLTRLPALLFDYLNDHRIAVDTWPESGRDHITKEEILALAMNGESTPPKTSRHTMELPIPKIRVPLNDLRSP